MADKIQMKCKLMNRKMELRKTPRTKLLKDIKYKRNFKRHLGHVFSGRKTRENGHYLSRK